MSYYFTSVMNGPMAKEVKARKKIERKKKEEIVS